MAFALFIGFLFVSLSEQVVIFVRQIVTECCIVHDDKSIVTSRKEEQTLMQSRLIVLIATITCLFTVSHSIYAETSLDGFNVIAENEYLQLYLNSEIVEIAVLDKRSGDIWYSNPYDRDKRNHC